MLRGLRLSGIRGYAAVDATFGPGPQIVWGPNAAGKTSLVEAIVLAGWGRSHRTTAEGELIRWGGDAARVEAAVADSDAIEVTIVRSAPSGIRKRVRVNGIPRRPAALGGVLRLVVFAPEDMLLIAGAPGLRRSAIDDLAEQLMPAQARNGATYARVLQQRNALLRAIREERAARDELRFWNDSFLDAGAAVVASRQAALAEIGGPIADAHAEIAPGEAARAPLGLTYLASAPARPGEAIRDALARRLAETADKEIWNGTTLVGPHRDDLAFVLEGRDLASFASRGQQRTAILAFKLATIDLLTARDGRPPLLLLDDVFSELDPDRRSHLVRRISGLPQAFVTTTTLDDLDPGLRARATTWEVRPDTDPGVDGVGARLVGPGPGR